MSLIKQVLISVLFSFPYSHAPGFTIPSEQHTKSKILIDDDFNRSEENDLLEQIGNGWGTNSEKRAKGVKQVDLVEGSMKITRAKEADHGVSVTHEASFQDAALTLRFKLGENDDLGINLADMNEKSVHAGHLCVARIRLNQLEITDLKTGRMNSERRQRRQSGNETKEDKKQVASKTYKRSLNLEANRWCELEVTVVGDRMVVKINGVERGSFESDGIAHPTKSRIRLSVNRNAWVDDLKLVRLK